MTRRLLIEIIAALFIILFLYTAINKLLDYETFKRALAAAGPTMAFASVLAWLIPTAEIVIVGLLFFPATKKAGMYASTILMFAFTGYITYMLVGTTFRPCGCGGVIQSFTWQQHLIFNIVFTLLGFLGILLMRSKKNFSGPTHKELLRPV